MIIKVACNRAGQMIYEFDNGNIVSLLWAWGSYSDNHDFLPYGDYSQQEWETTTVEVYSMGEDNNGLTKYLERSYGQNPAGYVDVKDIPTILKRADKRPKDA